MVLKKTSYDPLIAHWDAECDISDIVRQPVAGARSNKQGEDDRIDIRQGDCGNSVGESRAAAGKSFADKYPILAGEWHPTLNAGIDPYALYSSSATTAWWLCPTCGYEWQSQVRTRALHKTGCPKCVRLKQSTRACATEKTEKTPEGPLMVYPMTESVGLLHPDLMVWWHPVANHDLNPFLLPTTYRNAVWWLCPTCGYEWQSIIGVAAGCNGVCPACRDMRKRHKAKSVLCIETGEVYSSDRLAAAVLGIKPGAMARACREHQEVAGLHWRYTS